MRLHTSLVLALVTLLAALSQTAMAGTSAPANTDYVVSNQAGIGLVRAFDDGTNTILQFADLDTQRPKITRPNGKELSYRRVANFAVLPGLFNSVRVTLGKQVGVVAASAAQMPPARATPTKSSPAPASTHKKDPNPGAVAAAKPGAKGAKGDGHTAGSHTLARHAGHSTKEQGKAAGDGQHPSTDAQIKAAVIHVINERAHRAKNGAVEVPLPVWRAPQGSTLHAVVDAWAHQAGWTVLWQVPSNISYPIRAPIQYQGTFIDTVHKLMSRYAAGLRTNIFVNPQHLIQVLPADQGADQ